MHKKILISLALLPIFAISMESKQQSPQKQNTAYNYSNSKNSSQNLLAISWQNAFCQTHQNKKECKNLTAKSFSSSNFVLHGLWPQPHNNQYCNVDKKQIGMDKNKQWNRLTPLVLTPTTQKNLQIIMPGYESNLHLHEWVKHGTCYGATADVYYGDTISLVSQINKSKVKTLFVKNIGKEIEINEVKKAFDESFGKGAGDRVSMACQNGLISELRINLAGKGKDFKSMILSGKPNKGGCKKGRVDEAGF
jgi:ribonuclease T2